MHCFTLLLSPSHHLTEHAESDGSYQLMIICTVSSFKCGLTFLVACIFTWDWEAVCLVNRELPGYLGLASRLAHSSQSSRISWTLVSFDSTSSSHTYCACSLHFFTWSPCTLSWTDLVCGSYFSVSAVPGLEVKSFCQISEPLFGLCWTISLASWSFWHFHFRWIKQTDCNVLLIELVSLLLVLMCKWS